MMMTEATIVTRHGKTLRGVPARVLLGEDDADMRALLAELLRADGHEVFEAKNGAELIEYIGMSLADSGHLGSFDLIVSDIVMPGWTGMEVLESLRSAQCRTPVILITAFGDPGTHEIAESLGATAVFDKPFDIDDLRTAVLHALSAVEGPRHA
jgi:CheY-like chemotaxis protein